MLRSQVRFLLAPLVSPGHERYLRGSLNSVQTVPTPIPTIAELDAAGVDMADNHDGLWRESRLVGLTSTGRLSVDPQLA